MTNGSYYNEGRGGDRHQTLIWVAALVALDRGYRLIHPRFISKGYAGDFAGLAPLPHSNFVYPVPGRGYRGFWETAAARVLSVGATSSVRS